MISKGCSSTTDLNGSVEYQSSAGISVVGTFHELLFVLCLFIAHQLVMNQRIDDDLCSVSSTGFPVIAFICARPFMG